MTAQPATTATITGTVRDDRGELVDGALVRVVNGATGYTFRSSSRAGGFVMPGLPVGGPYSVVIELFGYALSRRDGIVLRLG